MEAHLRTAHRPSLRKETRFSPTAPILLNRPELTTCLAMSRKKSGVCSEGYINVYLFIFLNSSSKPIASSVLLPTCCLRHLQRDIENQRAQKTQFMQQTEKLDEELRQNEGLLKRVCMEQKATKVICFTILLGNPSVQTIL